MISITLPSIFPETLRRAHDNIATSTVGPYELVVVADFERPSWASNRVVWVRETERRGCAHAHTVAAHHASGEFITATADDCAYLPGWDVIATANYRRRQADAGRMLCLGLHYGLVGTVFGIYYPNFPFLRREDALKIGYFDGNLKKGFTDSDLGLKVWSAGGRCEFTERRLIEITAEDQRKGTEDCPPDDLSYFLGKWAASYGRGFDTSHMRAINVDFDPDLHRELVNGFSVYDNTPEFVARATALSPPHLVESMGAWNIVWFRGAAYAVPQAAGAVDLTNDDDLARVSKAGGASFHTIPKARSYALQAKAASPPESELSESIGTRNIVKSNGGYYVVPQAIGPVDLALEADRSRPEVRFCRSIEEARRLCAAPDRNATVFARMGNYLKGVRGHKQP